MNIDIAITDNNSISIASSITTSIITNISNSVPQESDTKGKLEHPYAVPPSLQEQPFSENVMSAEEKSALTEVESLLRNEVTRESPRIGGAAVESSKLSTSDDLSSDKSDENNLKRERTQGAADDAADTEKKAARRERRSRFSDKPPDMTADGSQADLSALVTNIASIINAQSSGAQSSILSARIAPPVTPKESRELFVGNVLASGVSDSVLKEFLNSAMRQVGLVTGPEDPIVTCRMNAKFSFIELRTPEDSKLALNLNGIPFMGQCLKISRPSKYVGPLYTPKTWQEITGQAPLASTQVSSADFIPDPATKTFREVFIGNTSPEMTDVLLKTFLGGALQEMGLSCSGTENPLMQVRVNGKFSFAEFRTMEEAANSLNLNGIPFMNQSLKLSRPSKFEANTLCTFFSWDELLKKFISGELKLMTAGPTSQVIRIDNMVSSTELNDSALTEEVVQDTISECSQFGKVKGVIIPRPTGSTTLTGGVGKVFVEMSTEEEAKLTLVNLKGRKFDGKWVDVKFYPSEYFSAGNYDVELPHSVVCTAGAVPIDRVLLPRGGASIMGLAGTGMPSFGSSASSSVSAMLSSAGMGMGMSGMGLNMSIAAQNPWATPQGMAPPNQGVTGAGSLGASIGGLRALSQAELQSLGGGSASAQYRQQP